MSDRAKRGIIIFLLMQIFFVNLGFAMYYGMKNYKQKLDAERAAELAKELVIPDSGCDMPQWRGRNAGKKALKNILEDSGRPYRIVPPGAMVTMDHVPARINLHTDEDGVILNIRCG